MSFPDDISDILETLWRSGGDVHQFELSIEGEVWTYLVSVDEKTFQRRQAGHPANTIWEEGSLARGNQSLKRVVEVDVNFAPSAALLLETRDQYATEDNDPIVPHLLAELIDNSLTAVWPNLPLWKVETADGKDWLPVEETKQARLERAYQLTLESMRSNKTHNIRVPRKLQVEKQWVRRDSNRLIKILFCTGPSPMLLVWDNGVGMDTQTLNQWAKYRNGPNTRGLTQPTQPYTRFGIDANISKFGVGSKSAIFALGRNVIVQTKQGEGDVHCMELRGEELRDKEKKNRNVFASQMRHRNVGDITQLSADQSNCPPLVELIQSESESRSFTLVSVSELEEEHIEAIDSVDQRVTHRLAHIFYFYLHGYRALIESSELDLTADEKVVDVVVERWVGSTLKWSENLRSIDTPQSKMFASTERFSCDLELEIEENADKRRPDRHPDIRKVEIRLAYFPSVDGEETVPDDASDESDTELAQITPSSNERQSRNSNRKRSRGNVTSEDASVAEEPVPVIEKRKRRKRARSIFDVFWHGRLIPYTKVESLPFVDQPSIPDLLRKRLRGVIFLHDRFTVAPTKLRCRDDIESILTEAVLMLQPNRRRPPAAAFQNLRILKCSSSVKNLYGTFQNWLMECSEKHDKQFTFEQVCGSSDSPPMTLFKKVSLPALGRLWEYRLAYSPHELVARSATNWSLLGPRDSWTIKEAMDSVRRDSTVSYVSDIVLDLEGYEEVTCELSIEDRTLQHKDGNLFVIREAKRPPVWNLSIGDHVVCRMPRSKKLLYGSVTKIGCTGKRLPTGLQAARGSVYVQEEPVRVLGGELCVSLYDLMWPVLADKETQDWQRQMTEVEKNNKALIHVRFYAAGTSDDCWSELLGREFEGRREHRVTMNADFCFPDARVWIGHGNKRLVHKPRGVGGKGGALQKLNVKMDVLQLPLNTHRNRYPHTAQPHYADDPDRNKCYFFRKDQFTVPGQYLVVWTVEEMSYIGDLRMLITVLPGRPNSIGAVIPFSDATVMFPLAVPTDQITLEVVDQFNNLCSISNQPSEVSVRFSAPQLSIETAGNISVETVTNDVCPEISGSRILIPATQIVPEPTAGKLFAVAHPQQGRGGSSRNQVRPQFFESSVDVSIQIGRHLQLSRQLTVKITPGEPFHLVLPKRFSSICSSGIENESTFPQVTVSVHDAFGNVTFFRGRLRLTGDTLERMYEFTVVDGQAVCKDMVACSKQSLREPISADLKFELLKVEGEGVLLTSSFRYSLLPSAKPQTAELICCTSQVNVELIRLDDSEYELTGPPGATANLALRVLRENGSTMTVAADTVTVSWNRRPAPNVDDMELDSGTGSFALPGLELPMNPSIPAQHSVRLSIPLSSSQEEQLNRRTSKLEKLFSLTVRCKPTANSESRWKLKPKQETVRVGQPLDVMFEVILVDPYQNNLFDQSDETSFDFNLPPRIDVRYVDESSNELTPLKLTGHWDLVKHEVGGTTGPTGRGKKKTATPVRRFFALPANAKIVGTVGKIRWTVSDDRFLPTLWECDLVAGIPNKIYINGAACLPPAAARSVNRPRHVFYQNEPLMQLTVELRDESDNSLKGPCGPLKLSSDCISNGEVTVTGTDGHVTFDKVDMNHDRIKRDSISTYRAFLSLSNSVLGLMELACVPSNAVCSVQLLPLQQPGPLVAGSMLQQTLTARIQTSDVQPLPVPDRSVLTIEIRASSANISTFECQQYSPSDDSNQFNIAQFDISDHLFDTAGTVQLVCVYKETRFGLRQRQTESAPLLVTVVPQKPAKLMLTTKNKDQGDWEPLIQVDTAVTNGQDVEKRIIASDLTVAAMDEYNNICALQSIAVQLSVHAVDHSSHGDIGSLRPPQISSAPEMISFDDSGQARINRLEVVAGSGAGHGSYQVSIQVMKGEAPLLPARIQFLFTDTAELLDLQRQRSVLEEEAEGMQTQLDDMNQRLGDLRTELGSVRLSLEESEAKYETSFQTVEEFERFKASMEHRLRQSDGSDHECVLHGAALEIREMCKQLRGIRGYHGLVVELAYAIKPEYCRMLCLGSIASSLLALVVDDEQVLQRCMEALPPRAHAEPLTCVTLSSLAHNGSMELAKSIKANKPPGLVGFSHELIRTRSDLQTRLFEKLFDGELVFDSFLSAKRFRDRLVERLSKRPKGSPFIFPSMVSMDNMCIHSNGRMSLFSGAPVNYFGVSSDPKRNEIRWSITDLETNVAPFMNRLADLIQREADVEEDLERLQFRFCPRITEIGSEMQVLDNRMKTVAGSEFGFTKNRKRRTRVTRKTRNGRSG
eukprot:GILJ01015998.1.p1 GENE.GILJ01015998.1~~GILJ01015998.1.p1  ORF type:complete len:2285 (-),score=387.35 GILJ01015998.1:9-6863(-)